MLYATTSSPVTGGKPRLECCFKMPVPAARAEGHSVKGVFSKPYPQPTGRPQGSGTGSDTFALLDGRDRVTSWEEARAYFPEGPPSHGQWELGRVVAVTLLFRAVNGFGVI